MAGGVNRKRMKENPAAKRKRAQAGPKPGQAGGKRGLNGGKVGFELTQKRSE